MYKLHSTKAADAVWESLPDEALREFNEAIRLACEDPWVHTEPRERDDPRDVRRTITLQHTVAALLIIEGPPLRWLYLRNLDDLG
ncbi:hypothetical protein [Streptomyces sp. KN37]|uniref:hypothetical protein n=1 Tax=Streptomyces sp. KN37 TaxID=3090667 RepID=UPI002A7565C5|nr:hypothetical protein [Streptomyces sp. KN37]WPO69948.1 hypothetical protein R9806_04530 [Streptomyces sp. KN37]